MTKQTNNLSQNEIMEKFLDLACALSPENISCDGELSRTAISARYNSYMKQWASLEKILGKSVSEDDVWSWDAQKRKNKLKIG